MTFLSIICILIVEQFKTSPSDKLSEWLASYAAFLEQQFNGGEENHGKVAWMVGVALPAFLVWLLGLLLDYVNPVLDVALGLVVLYLSLGFRQFSHFFTDIQLALRAGELERARQLIAAWRGRSSERLGSADIVRVAIEEGILASQRHVFAPVFWFAVLGPAGVLLYRLGQATARHWRHGVTNFSGEERRFDTFACRAFVVLEWMPARLTAMAFAIVGDFEDAVYCWRTQANAWPETSSGILLASGAGALGIRLGMPLPDAMGMETRPELGLGDDADVDHLQSAIGLIWRALLLCLLLLALMTVMHWAGG